MNLRTQNLLKLHKLFKEAGEDGSDTGGGGDDVALLDGNQEGEDEDAGADAGEVDPASADAEDEVSITIGDEPANEDAEDQARAPEWVRDLRKSNREKDRVIRELQAKLAKPEATPSSIVLGVKPTLASCDFDEAKFESDLEAWHSRKQEIENQQRARTESEQKAKDAWQAKLADYGKAKGALKVKDFEDAEATAQETFSVTQQGVILNGSDNAAAMIYALGKNPKKAKELAAISDPVKFAFAVAKLETQLKVNPRKTAPVPERVVRGGTAVVGTLDSQLERLRADAEKTGDYTKVHQYKQQKRNAQR